MCGDCSAWRQGARRRWMNLCELQLLPHPLPPPQRRLRRWGGGEKIGVLQAGVARLQNPTKKFPLLPALRGGKGSEDRGQKLILNLHLLP